MPCLLRSQLLRNLQIAFTFQILLCRKCALGVRQRITPDISLDLLSQGAVLRVALREVLMTTCLYKVSGEAFHPLQSKIGCLQNACNEKSFQTSGTRLDDGGNIETSVAMLHRRPA